MDRHNASAAAARGLFMGAPVGRPVASVLGKGVIPHVRLKVEWFARSYGFAGLDRWGAVDPAFWLTLGCLCAQLRLLRTVSHPARGGVWGRRARVLRGVAALLVFVLGARVLLAPIHVGQDRRAAHGGHRQTTPEHRAPHDSDQCSICKDLLLTKHMGP